MTTIPAIYENGVFRPLGKVDLPEHTQVDVSVPATSDLGGDPVERQAKLWELLSRRYDGGDPRVAERHNEHQP